MEPNDSGASTTQGGVAPSITVERARQVLDDFVLVVRRTQWLYTTVAPQRDKLPAQLQGDLPSQHSLGYFEPVTLCLCWFDFLGALYSGVGEPANRERVVAWLRFMGDINPKYRQYAEDLYRCYRNFLVHQYSPKRGGFGYGADGHQHLDLLSPDNRPAEERTPYLDVPQLLDDLVAAIEKFREILTSKPLVPDHGSVEAFARALCTMGWRCW
jgi:hypothetical protein